MGKAAVQAMGAAEATEVGLASDALEPMKLLGSRQPKLMFSASFLSASWVAYRRPLSRVPSY